MACGDGDPHLFQILTREQFKICFAIAMTAQTLEFSGSYDLDKYYTDGMEGPTDDWSEMVRRVIRYLALRLGYSFGKLQVYDDGRIIGPVAEEGNFLYVMKMRQGGLPDVIDALRTAIRIGQAEIPELDTAPLRACLSEAIKQRETWMKALSPGERVRLEREGQEALASVGVHRLREIN